MSEKDDYADKELPPPWFLRFMVRKVLPVSAITLIIGVIIVVALFAQTRRGEHDMTLNTISDAKSTVRDLLAIHDAIRKYPTRLTDVKSSEGIRLTDAWGNPFRYAIVPNESGESEAYVWTERIKNGKLTLIGAKVQADGTVISFGLPAD